MPKVKIKKTVEYNTVVPRPKNRTQKGQLRGKVFEVKPVAELKKK